MSRVNYYQSAIKSQKEKPEILAEMPTKLFDAGVDDYEWLPHCVWQRVCLANLCVRVIRVNYYQSAFNSQKEKQNILAEMLKILKMVQRVLRVLRVPGVLRVLRVNYYQSAFNSQKEKLNILAEMLKISKSGLRTLLLYNRPLSL